MTVRDLREAPGPCCAVVSDLDYAVPVHENLTARHPTGQAKFLETAALESRAEVEQMIGAAVRRRLG